MITHTPDMMVLKLRKREYAEMLNIFYAQADSLLISDAGRSPSQDILSELKTASLLMEWILETPEDGIVEHFGVGPGDIRTIVELSDWLLYSAGEIGKVFGLKEAIKALSLLRIRVSYGVREELLELVTLRGIGRVRGSTIPSPSSSLVLSRCILCRQVIIGLLKKGVEIRKRDCNLSDSYVNLLTACTKKLLIISMR